MRSIDARLKKLENQPESVIPKFVLVLADGSTEKWTGLDIISRLTEGDVRRVYFDERQQSGVDAAALLAALYGDTVEIIPK